MVTDPGCFSVQRTYLRLLQNAFVVSSGVGRQREGIAAAKAKGKQVGAKPKLTPEQVEEIRQRVASGQQRVFLKAFVRLGAIGYHLRE